MAVLRRSAALLGRIGESTALLHETLGQPAWLAALGGSRTVSGGSRGLCALAGPAMAADIRSSSLGSHWAVAAAGRQPAAGAAAAAALEAAASPSQLLHHRSFAAGSGRTTALRRLRRAGARASAGSRASREVAAARVAAGGGDVEAGPATDVVPREGPASEVQVSSVVDHPALIVTRPVEWCAHQCMRPHPAAAGAAAAGCGCSSVSAKPAGFTAAFSTSASVAAPPPCRGTVLLGFEQANRYTIYDQHGGLACRWLPRCRARPAVSATPAAPGLSPPFQKPQSPRGGCLVAQSRCWLIKGLHSTGRPRSRRATCQCCCCGTLRTTFPAPACFLGTWQATWWRCWQKTRAPSARPSAGSCCARAATSPPLFSAPTVRHGWGWCPGAVASEARGGAVARKRGASRRPLRAAGIEEGASRSCSVLSRRGAAACL